MLTIEVVVVEWTLHHDDVVCSTEIIEAVYAACSAHDYSKHIILTRMLQNFKKISIFGLRVPTYIFQKSVKLKRVDLSTEFDKKTNH